MVNLARPWNFGDRLAQSSTVSVIGNQPAVPDKIIQMPNVMPNVVTFAPRATSRTRRQFNLYESSPFALEEIIRAEDTETYVARAFREYQQQILREGWAFDGPNQKYVDWINRRLMEIFVLTGKSFSMVLRDIIGDVIRFSNAYIVKSRVARGKNIGSGRPYRMDGREHQPISGLWPADPVTMSAQRDHRGRILYYRQYHPRTGRKKIWSKSEVIHITYNKRTGEIFGVPFLVPVLDDIRMLRRLEEYVDLIAGIYATPILHWKVGTPERPAGRDPFTKRLEVDDARRQIERMPNEGFLVTSERHQAEFLGIKDKAIDLSKYIEHFKERVVGGVGLSGITLGQGDTANRSTASQLMQVGVNHCKDMQAAISEIITATLVVELLLEGKFPLRVNDMPTLEFEEIDVEEKRARENHALNLFNAGGITETELRKEMRRNSMSDQERNNDVVERVERRRKEMEGAISAKYAPAPAAGTSSSSKSKTGTAAKKTTANRTQPENQSGKKATKTKVTKNDALLRINTECRLMCDWFVRKDGPLAESVVKETLTDFAQRLENIVAEYVRILSFDIADQSETTRPNADELSRLVDSFNKTLIDQYVNIWYRSLQELTPYEDKPKINHLINALNMHYHSVIDSIESALTQETQDADSSDNDI